MILDRSRLLVRWFFWSHAIIDAFTESDGAYRMERNGTNLCQFMRVILVWAPLILIWQVVVILAAAGAVALVPIFFWGVGGYSAVVGSIIGIVLLIWGFNEWRDRHPRRHRPPRTEPTAVEVVWAFVKAKKAHICPMISFAGGRR